MISCAEAMLAHHGKEQSPRACLCRAVNALLTQLDNLKAHTNVMILTTSNITEAIDLAFVDRADIKAYIGPPSWQVRAPPSTASIHCTKIMHLCKI